MQTTQTKRLVNTFLSTPSARRATPAPVFRLLRLLFLSTPSARRATTGALIWHKSPCDFYPRPPRGGRPAKRIEF